MGGKQDSGAYKVCDRGAWSGLLYPGVKEYIHGPKFKEDVPLLEEPVVMEGVAHFINQEKPQEILQIILDFISKF